MGYRLDEAKRLLREALKDGDEVEVAEAIERLIRIITGTEEC